MKGNDRRRLGRRLTSAVYLAAVTVAVALLCGCTSTKYVPVETVRTEYKEADTAAIYNRLLSHFESQREKESRHDSLFDRLKETVIIRENGDTARYDRERIIYRATHREKELEQRVLEQDSIIKALKERFTSVKVDSVAVPYPMERKLTKWERTKIAFGGGAMGVCGAAFMWLIVWIVKSLR